MFDKSKSGIILRDTWSKRQAGAMRPVRRVGWVWAASCAPAAKKLRGLGIRAQARCISISLSFSVVGVSSFLSPPRSAIRRGAWKGNTQHGELVLFKCGNQLLKLPDNTKHCGSPNALLFLRFAFPCAGFHMPHGRREVFLALT